MNAIVKTLLSAAAAACLACSLSCCAGAASAHSAAPDPILRPEGPVALVGGLVVDGMGSAPVPNGTVVFQEGRIVYAGEAAGAPLSPGCTVIDVEGAAVLPGLINAHVHNAFYERHAEIWAQCGITTVRDLSVDRGGVPAAVSFRDRVRRDPRYCRILTAGTLITVPRGYMAAGGIRVRGRDDAAARVNEEIDQGVDFVKIILQQPASWLSAAMTPEVASAIVSTAHARGVRVTAHVGTTADLRTALDAGADDICHITTDPLTEDLITRMVSRGIILQPTLTDWNTTAERPTVIDNLRRFVAAGGRVALGAEHIHTAHNVGPFIGFPMAELLMMEEAGMSPLEIITASTRTAAEVCGIGDVVGTLEAGRTADILVVNGNPLTDLSAFLEVRMVVHDGAIIRGE